MGLPPIQLEAVQFILAESGDSALSRFHLAQDSDIARKKAECLFEEVYRSLRLVLPSDTEIIHIGSTALPGLLTKGDLDVVVRIGKGYFSAADAILAERFKRNTGSIRTDYFSAFENPASEPHLGIQLVVKDGPLDFFHTFVQVLQENSALVDEYNKLKLSYDGTDEAAYRAAKSRFVERVLEEAAK